MAVKIRLSRLGKKKTPFFRIVAVDERRKRDGSFLADIGTYDGLKGSIVTFDRAVFDEWISKGAIPTDSVKKIHRAYKKGSVLTPVSLVKPSMKKTTTSTSA
jgi:small subunit ribosomal protein S16